MHTALLALGLVARAAAPDATWAYVASSLVKLGPGVQAERSPAISLDLGRGECQAAQVVIPAGRPLTALRATCSALRGAGGALEVALSREVALLLQQPSNVEGAVGAWPDILVPAVDPIAHEPRRAFPFDGPGDIPTVIYAEVCAPAHAAPGAYRGELELSAQGRGALRFPIEATVHRYTLPATSSLPTAFGFSGLSAADAHGLDRKDPEVVMRLTQRYATLALAHRVSLFGMTQVSPPLRHGPNGVQVDFRDYDRELAPFLDGTALPSGARFTSLELRGPAGVVSDADREAYYRQTVEHLRQRGWLDRIFLYAPDEPKPARFPEVQRVSTLAHQADRRIRVLVTASKQDGLAGTADLWTPNIACLFRRPEGPVCPATVPLEAYAADRARGAKLWWYQSCLSHGCGPVPPAHAREYAGWPSYMVDFSIPMNRAMGAAAYRFGIDGELYYSTTEAYDGDPWHDVWRYHGNGDGTLFYPGTPARIGGKTDVPLASLRLKAIRDGLQDYELLRLADGLGLRAEAQRTAALLVPQAWHVEPEPQVWIRARRALIQAIDAKLAGSSAR